ncbi:cytochrome c biogenesis heme-transporting ATPase CcmA [Alteromonas halophila]|uniref:Cytochrome c biogenesis ATP-binding export protein CcmA n=1 Tax=Alteromonas halophila TaxID=516698 RepID=A0A918MU76_9ALTE|nr:cytochrome c biogenesis heme-transporting ATPase CcmA [Alteromonas halophila]GGW72931.1 cytochrome c biogenesis ATP-binding export protein CcmA [Alteromonas halophila]
MSLVASELTCIKRDRVLFERLSMSLEPGQLVYLRGPNGAGKTSLLRILTGLAAPDAGTVYFQGAPVSNDIAAYHKALIYLGHKPALNSTLSAMENLRFWLAQQYLTFDPKAAYQALEKLGLVGLEDIPVRLLSAGQQRRAALARLWLKPASVWLLDEPFTALDTQGIALLETLFAHHVADGGMLLTTSHQPLSKRAGPVTNMDLEYRL